MDIVFLGIIIFLFLLAIFDLSVGVSNDAVNFLNSAIGAKAASFRVIITIAAIGVFMGAVMSNGMMDIARHGIFRPEYFHFYELICIFMAVMTTDIVLLDVFNSLGMPTSTTVSMVFELLGASFALAIWKVATDPSGLTFLDLLNTDKALSVILGIFLSVGIAFFFGSLVQYLTRLFFTFDYRRKLTWKIGLFGGVATTAIIYFLLIKGVKDLAFMTPENKAWLDAHTAVILGGCLVGFTLLMQLLHWCKVNVFRIVVLLGTFSLAMAFAGNDLVNFIGVPLAGFSAYQDYMANGTGNPNDFLMGSLNAPAQTPLIFLAAAGAIMVYSLATSKKAYNVVKTSVDLARQDVGDEMFGSSRVARTLVRRFIALSTWVVAATPAPVRAWVGSRFNTEESIMEQGAAFDLVRASINLVLAGLLVALGTSLADRAWSRETAVFRITGVLSVIGGWFITAGAAFIAAALVVTVMYLGGQIAIFAIAALSVFLLIRSHIRYNQKKQEEQKDQLFFAMLECTDKAETWKMLRRHINQEQYRFMGYALTLYRQVTNGFLREDLKALRKAEHSLADEKTVLKNVRRKEILCLRRVSPDVAIEHNTWIHLGLNSCVSIMYNLRRIAEFCREHVDNNFMPLPEAYASEFLPIRDRILTFFDRAMLIWEAGSYEETIALRSDCEEMKSLLSIKCRTLFNQMQAEDPTQLTVLYVYLNMLQESQEMLSALRHLLRAGRKIQKEQAPIGRDA